jgi:hypothetical protein
LFSASTRQRVATDSTSHLHVVVERCDVSVLDSVLEIGD